MDTEWLSDGLAIWPVVIPIGAAALTMLLRRRFILQRGILETAVVLMLIASVLLLGKTSGGETLVMRFGGWARPFGVTFVADVLSATLCAAASVVALAVTVFALADIRARRRRAGFD